MARKHQDVLKSKAMAAQVLKDAINNTIDVVKDDIGHMFSQDKPIPQDINNNPYDIIDIVTFCEHPYYLGEKLFPWQKIILKIFYMGQPGNTHLTINDSQKKNCANCVWDENRLGIQSPCLNCQKFEQRKKDLFFDTEIELRRMNEKNIEIWKNMHPEQDNFINEAELIARDLPDAYTEDGTKLESTTEKVRNQILSKMGKKFVELILVLGRRSGKALYVNTPILTTDGWKRMHQIETGDKVFGPDGEPTQVVAISPTMTNRPCYKLIFSTGEEITADEQHEWAVNFEEDKEVHSAIKTTKELFESKNKYFIFPCENKDYRQSNSHIYIKQIKKVASVPVKCIQVANSSQLYLAGETFIPTHNSLMTSIIALYEAYQLIEMKNPHKKYNILDGDPITILNVAVSELQAKEAIFEKIKALVLRSPYFEKKVNKSAIRTQSIRFFTQADEESNEELEKRGIPAKYEGSIQILSGTSSANSQVGKTLACVILDEMASMIQSDTSKMSDKELYDKLKPSIATFAPYGKIICISNPLTQSGQFWELYNRSFDDDSILMFQLPTQMCNPSIDAEWLESEKQKDPETWKMQYGAEFSGGAIEPLIPQEMIDYAFERGAGLAKQYYGAPVTKYFAHADPALNSDMYAFAICHSEFLNTGQKKIVVDHINVWVPNPGQPVNIDAVDSYIIEMCKRFNIVSLTYDQWNSAASIQKMYRNGIPARQTSFSRSFKAKIYTTLLHLFINNLIDIYDIGACASEAKVQLKNLQKKFNQQSFRIEAARGFNDDIPDCLAGAAYQALESNAQISLPIIRGAKLGIDPGERMHGMSAVYPTRTGKYF
jgi:hypothetical protein